MNNKSEGNNNYFLGLVKFLSLERSPKIGNRKAC